MPQIEVTFDIDANGILNVHANVMGTSKDQRISITASSGLSEAEIQRMVKEAESNEAEDKKRKEAVEARNHLDTLVFQLEKTLNDSRDKIDAGTRAEVETALADSKKTLEDHKDAADGQIFKDAFERLQKASYKMAEQLYKDAGAAGAGAAGAGAPPPSASDAETTQQQKDVIDAEFEEHS